MAHRRFVDASDVEWDAWDVHPGRVERREGVTGVTPPRGIERRFYDDPEIRVRLSPELSNGWLTFECSHERRRLVPIPPDWAQLSDQALTELLESAQPVGRRHRLVE